MICVPAVRFRFYARFTQTAVATFTACARNNKIALHVFPYRGIALQVFAYRGTLVFLVFATIQCRRICARADLQAENLIYLKPSYHYIL